MANYIVSDTTLTSIANAIRTKGGTSASLSFPTEFISAIAAIDSGSGGSSGSDSLAPANDGKTHIHIYIDPDAPSNRMSFTLRWVQSESNGVIVDWGDETNQQSFSDSGYAVDHEHTYSAGGFYDISLEVVDGTLSFEGSNKSSGSGIYGTRDSVGCSHNPGRIIMVELGDNVVSIGQYSFYGCWALSNIILSDDLTTIGAYAFGNCLSLTHMTIPASVTSIGNYALTTGYGVSEFHIESQEPQYLGSYVFTTHNQLKIYVPAGTGDTYKSASNWSSYGTYIEEESA